MKFGYPFIHLAGEGLCESKLSCPGLELRPLDPVAREVNMRQAVNVVCFFFAGSARITNLRRACVCHGVSCTHII